VLADSDEEIEPRVVPGLPDTTGTSSRVRQSASSSEAFDAIVSPAKKRKMVDDVEEQDKPVLV
jgi:hypothetical protein